MQRANIKKRAGIYLTVVLAAVAARGNGNTELPASEMPIQWVDLSNVPLVGGRGEEIRAMLERILETEYCGDAAMDGVTQAAGLNGKAPVDGAGFVKLAEEDWPVVLAEMTEEQFERMLREGKTGWGPDVRRLWNMLDLLGGAKKNTDGIILLLQNMARQTAPEWDSLLLRALSCAWIHLTLERDGAAKALELGRFWAEVKGVDSREFRTYVYALGMCNSFEECKTDEDRAEMARFIGEMSERCATGETALEIDKIAAGTEFYHLNPDGDDPWAYGPAYEGAPGWVGSLQRRQMAERFRDWIPFGYTVVRGADGIARTPATARKLQNTFSERVANELAADEKDLTDLREVYGAWASDDDATDTSSPLTEP